MEGTKETIVYVVFGILLAFGINQCLAFAFSTDMPIVAVESNSMIPTFYKGDILILQGEKDYKKGDVIVFSPPGHSVPVVHRVIKINDDGTYQTCGDANKGVQLAFEKHIDPDEIHGKMIFRIPMLGWVKIGLVEYLLPNIGLIMIIIIPIGVIYYLFFIMRR